MRPLHLSTESWIEYNFEDVDCTVTFDFWPGDPGKTSGPPENCYPEEPAELEMTKVEVNGKDVLVELSDKTLEGLHERVYGNYDEWMPRKGEDY
jgi:hypothetical protein